MEAHRMMRWFQIAAIAVILLLAAGLYKAKTDAESARARVAELTREVRDARAEVQALRAEAAHLESPAHVEALAKQKLELEFGVQARRDSDIDRALPPPRSP
jgi:cell division protein FtsL